MTIRRLAILDTETTGTDDADQAVEVAVVLFDVPRAAAVASWSSLIRADENPAERVNGIPAELLREAPPAEEVWAALRVFCAGADAFAAHGAAFDRARVPETVWEGRGWVCTMDLGWPAAVRSGENLVGLALRHGLGVASAHRAMADCDLLVRLFARAREMGADLQEMIARGLRERAKFAAIVPRERNQELKQAGFRWDPERRVWWREMAVEDAAELPFPTRRLGEGGGEVAVEVAEVVVDFEAVRRRAAELLAAARGE